MSYIYTYIIEKATHRTLLSIYSHRYREHTYIFIKEMTSGMRRHRKNK